MSDNVDRHFVSRLRSAGVFDAAQAISLRVEDVFLPLARHVNHPYRQFRWSVGTDEHGNAVIHALPPEEEIGWTPWERWSSDGNMPRRSEWVLFPHRADIGDRTWYEPEPGLKDLKPRFHPRKDITMGQVLLLSRVYEAAGRIALHLYSDILQPITAQENSFYFQYRWVVIPHALAADLPVIYALPPMHMSDVWPWESWYTDDGNRLLHHVHFTRPNDRTTGRWCERDGAPQRPPEIFGVDWYWYDDPSMTPALAGKDQNFDRQR